MSTHKHYAITKLSYIQPNSEGITRQQAHMNYLAHRPDKGRKHGPDRWINHGLGNNSDTITQSLQKYQSKQVHAWNLIISPNPRILTDLKHPVMKENFIRYLVEHTIDDWFQAQGHSVSPRYSYVYHDKDSEMTGMQQPHAHIVMAATIQPFSSNKAYRLQKAEIDLLQQAINTRIEHVQERFSLTLDHKTRERDIIPDIPFFTFDEKEKP